MINLKLLNKIIFQFLLLIVFLPIHSEETVDIWKSDTNSELDKDTPSEQKVKKDNISIYKKVEPIKNSIEEDKNFDLEKKLLVGIFDPAENNLTIDMWKNSDGKIVMDQLKRIENINLSKDAENILYTVLFTNSYPPQKNISPNIFINYKSEWLIKKKKVDLIKLYLDKNPDLKENSKLIHFLIDEYLAESDLSGACEQIKFYNQNNKNINLEKFKIYCLINDQKIEEAQLQYDLLIESGFVDKFYDKKINFLLGYLEKPDDKISDKNLFNFYLSHKVNSNFSYEPNAETSKYIWRYMSSANLIYDSEEIDLEDESKINLLEKAVSQGSYNSKQLFNIYKRFLFNINQFLTVEDSYQLLNKFKGRALLYQSVLLSEDLNRKFRLIILLNNLFKNDDIENAFSEELKIILSTIDKEKVPKIYQKFYNKNLYKKNQEGLKKVKFNNKIIHRSKLLRYFIDEKYNNNNLNKDLETVYKKIKKDKKYFFSIKDIILLESLKSDGQEIPKKLEKLYSIKSLTIPTNLIALTVENQVALILLKIVEIVGEDKLENLDPDTLYFVTATLNKLGLKKIRNNIIINTLPERI
tara:strand:- start:169 stop:1917 length:1749 start_codon:yes stop_codon:yes gene_type:complete